MHKLGDQWIEVIDGEEHMFKAVTPIVNGHPDIKDLGILNYNGLLQCPFCGEYPTPKEELDENDERIYAVEHECYIDVTTGWNHDRQTVIDNWNRRA
jgi:hypothetical protein